MHIVGDVQPRLLTFLPWDDTLPVAVGTTGPEPGAAALEIPGAVRTPLRTWLEPTAGPNGAAGRIVDPDGRARPLAAAPDGRLLTLPARPSGLAPRARGVWMLTEDSLIAVEPDGAVAVDTGFTGVRLVPARDGAVWLLGLDSCRHVTRDGQVTAAVPWPDPFNACPDGDNLCGWDPGQPGFLVITTPDGTLERRDTGGVPAPFERPLAAAGTSVLSARLQTLVYRSGDVRSSLTMIGAGLTADGQPFLAAECDGRAWLWRAGARPIALPLLDGGPRQVLRACGDRILVRAGGTALWWENGAARDEVAVDETTYREKLFADSWVVTAPFPFSATADATVVLAASGPTGIAVLAVRWLPEATRVAR